MKQLLVSIAVGLTAMLVWPRAAFACSCRDQTPSSAQQRVEWFAGFDGAVFRGTVIASEQVQRPVSPRQPVTGELRVEEWKVTLRVERHWKGVTTSEIVVYTPLDDGMCGVRFRVGGVYLVAAAPSNDGLTASVCTLGWFHTRDPEAFRTALGEGSPPPAP